MRAISRAEVDPVISFPVGYHELHPDVSVNFQMNRFYGWVGDDSMLAEMREAVAGVHDYPTLTTIFLELGDKALARHEMLKGAYYLRLAEFFLFTQDPRKLPTRQRFLDLILSYFKIPSSAYSRIPYGSGWCPPIASLQRSPRERSSYLAGSTATLRNGCPLRCSFATLGTIRSYSRAPARGARSNWRTCP
jgi:hypothetical protein